MDVVLLTKGKAAETKRMQFIQQQQRQDVRIPFTYDSPELRMSNWKDYEGVKS